MPDYNRIQYYCQKSSAMSEQFIDNFLLHLCAVEEGFEKKFAGMLSDYQKVLQKMPENWPLWLTSQYIVFQLFHKDGLAPKYLNHLQVRRRSVKELDYLRFQIEHPWRFVFCQIEENPKGYFFEMKDLFTGENFLLYSEGIAATEKQQGAMALYFLLIGFNGECWQTYGALNYFKGIQPFDILFFAKQLKPDLVSPQEIPGLIDVNPLPFIMLWVGGELPLPYHKKDMVVIVSSEYKTDEFDFEKFTTDFIIKQKPPVYMLSLKHWHTFPHFSKCFYHAEKKTLYLNAMTDRGYVKLLDTLNQLGYQFPQEPQIRVTPAMVTITEQVLGREIKTNPYESLFTEKPSPEATAELDKINSFLRKLMDAYNSGADYDLRDLAFLAGIEYETAKEIEEQVNKKFRSMWRSK